MSRRGVCDTIWKTVESHSVWYIEICRSTHDCDRGADEKKWDMTEGDVEKRHGELCAELRYDTSVENDTIVSIRAGAGSRKDSKKQDLMYNVLWYSQLTLGKLTCGSGLLLRETQSCNRDWH